MYSSGYSIITKGDEMNPQFKKVLELIVLKSVRPGYVRI